MNQINYVVLGGRHAISYKIGALFLPFLIFSIPLTENHPTHKEFLEWTIASTLSLIITTGLLYTLDKTLLKNRFTHPIPNNAVFAVGMLLGAVRGAGTYCFAKYPFHIPSNTPSSGFIRMVNSAILGGVSFALIALISFSFYEIRRARSESQDFLYGIDQLISTEKDDRSQMELFKAVSLRLELTRSQMLAIAKGSDHLEPESIANTLRELATNLIRPLSHQVAGVKRPGRQTVKDYLSPMLLLPDSIKRQMPWFLFFYALGEARVDLLRYGIIRGSILLALNVSIICILMYGLVYIFKRGKPRYVNVFIFPLIIAVINSSLNILTHSMIHDQFTSTNYLTSLSWTIFIIYLVSYAGSYVSVSMQALSETKGRYSMMFQRITSHVNSSRALSEQLARFLHGSLQTKLITSAFRVRQASTEDEIRQELQFVADYMWIPEEIEEVGISGDLRETFNQIRETWSPLIQVQFEIKGSGSTTDLKAVGHLYDLINEVISNAHRHGSANSIHILAAVKRSEIAIEAINNGTLASPFKPGLGSKIFDSATNKRWELRNEGGLAKFTAKIPVNDLEN